MADAVVGLEVKYQAPAVIAPWTIVDLHRVRNVASYGIEARGSGWLPPLGLDLEGAGVADARERRWLNRHPLEIRRAGPVAVIGLVVGLVILPFVTWPVAVVVGWDVSALAFLITVWPMIRRADGARTERLAKREDEPRGPTVVLLIGASLVSLLGVGLVLVLAGRHGGSMRFLLIGLAILTVVASWTVVNTVYTLRYADLHYGSAGGGFGFGDPTGSWQPGYRDFAYVAFTIGMTYQVSDTTLRNPAIRRTVLGHAILSYVFGVVIVAGSVSLIAGLVQ
jgi:uncharacterized membrane protein